ncbi:MAG: LmeA family phospholipid-binding protein [Rubrobacteraceae bacterium]
MLGLLLLLVVVVLIGTYTFIPPVLNNTLERDLQSRLNLQNRPDVKLKSSPPPEMLVGKFSRGVVDLKYPRFGGVRPEKVTLVLDPFNVKVLESLTNGAFETRKQLSGDLRVALSEKEVQRIAKSRVKSFPIDGLNLQKNGVAIQTSVSVFGFKLPVRVMGKLSLRSGKLDFRPQQIDAAGMPIPKNLSRQLLSGVDFSYALGKLPYGITINRLQVMDKRLVLKGRMERIPSS